MNTNTLGIIKTAGIILILLSGIGILASGWAEDAQANHIRELVQRQASAWETGDETLLDEVLHDDVVFAYPGRRLNKEQALEDLRAFRAAYSNTKVYIHTVVIDGDNVAVEWQFATTKNETGKREVVSDAIIAKVKDGKFISWKEYLDGRVKLMQAEGTLELEEGEEPFPWPNKIEIRAN
jgi:uncharacterized protein (TIGR02246 family)